MVAILVISMKAMLINIVIKKTGYSLTNKHKATICSVYQHSYIFITQYTNLGYMQSYCTPPYQACGLVPSYRKPNISA